MAPRESVSATLERLRLHLTQVEHNPAIPLDTSLFETLQPFVASPDVIDPATSQALTTQLARLLPTLQQDPTPAIQLLIKLIEPYDFDAIRSIQPPVDFAAGLDPAAVPYHPLALSLLEKASLNLRHAEFIASSPEVVSRLIQLWLSTEDIGIAARASNVLYDFLKVDKDPANPTATEGPVIYGPGFMWKRVFGDRDIYSLFFRFCAGDALRTSQKTVAQVRLMAWLPKVGELSWEAITHSQHPDVEEGLGYGSAGLLDFAALHVVDYNDDVLMHISLIEFYSDLLKTCNQPAKGPTQSNSLIYLKTSGLHDQTLSYFLNPSSHESFEISYLYRPAANYLSTYTTTYPEDFEASSETSNATLHRLMDVFSNTKPAHWVHGHSPQHDLHVLASLPRRTLLPGPSTLWDTTPLSRLPASRSTNADVLRTFATIFHGPEDPAQTLTFPPRASAGGQTTSAQHAAERSAARDLLILFLQHNTSFFADLAGTAETLALKDTALAALDLIAALATADWAASASFPAPDFPLTGIELLCRPGNPIVPLLLRPTQSFSNLVGGRGADAENAAYQIAARKFEVLQLVRRRLQVAEGEIPGAGGLVRLFVAREAEGVWGRGGDVGGRIGTVEL